MTPRRRFLAASLVLVALAAVAAVAMGEIVVIPHDPPEPLDALTAELLELFEDGKDAAGEIELPSAAGACAGCHGRSLSPFRGNRNPEAIERTMGHLSEPARVIPRGCSA